MREVQLQFWRIDYKQVLLSSSPLLGRTLAFMTSHTTHSTAASVAQSGRNSLPGRRRAARPRPQFLDATRLRIFRVKTALQAAPVEKASPTHAPYSARFGAVDQRARASARQDPVEDAAGKAGGGREGARQDR